MSRFYKLEVHFLDYDTIGVTADSEEHAHAIAKMMFETMHDHIIGVTAVGTVEIDGEEVENEYGGRDIVDDISEDDVEAIINNFITRYDNYIMHRMADEMRNAIRDVTGLIC